MLREGMNISQRALQRTLQVICRTSSGGIREVRRCGRTPRGVGGSEDETPALLSGRWPPRERYGPGLLDRSIQPGARRLYERYGVSELEVEHRPVA